MSMEEKGNVEVYDKLITTHIEKMWGGLEMASVQHFMDTGKINGTFQLRLIAMLQFHAWHLERKTAPFIDNKHPDFKDIRNQENEKLD